MMIAIQDEATLIEQAKQGDNAAFSQLVLMYQRRLGIALRRVIRNEETIDDVLQETFIQAHRCIPRFLGDSAFYTWLYRIGLNVAFSVLKAERRHPTSSIDADDRPEMDYGYEHDTPENILEGKQAAAILSATLDTMPPVLRQILTHREVEGMDYAEIAALLQRPLGSVKSRIFHARKIIAEALA